MFVIILLGGYALPSAYGPYATRAEAEAAMATVPGVEDPCIAEVEPTFTTWPEDGDIEGARANWPVDHAEGE